MDKHICAIIVTYQPDLPMLQKLIQRMRPQVGAIVVVDNTCWRGPATILPAIGDCAYLPMGSNKGVARAFNAGVEWAREQGCSHVLLMDQDSLPGDTMIQCLSAAEDRLLEDGCKVAAVGPSYSDPKYRVMRPFSRAETWRVRRYHCEGGDNKTFIPSDFVISSGSLLRISVLDAVGHFDESFFIDYVDIEWGLRANSLGFHSYGVCGAALEHSLAEDAITFWFLKTWSVPIHEPIRHYYFFRNAILLYRRSYISRVWKLRELSMLMLKAVFFSTVPAPRSKRLRMIALGLYHGSRNHSGPFRHRRADEPSDATDKRPDPVRPGLR
jgi:rhamnosyltransferase